MDDEDDDDEEDDMPKGFGTQLKVQPAMAGFKATDLAAQRGATDTKEVK